MKILLLTASAGNGHNSTAKRLKEIFLQKDPSCQIEIVDIYKQYASSFSKWYIEDGYMFACKNLIDIYNFFFKKSEKSNYKNRDKTSAHKNIYSMLHGVLNKIYEFKPDLIICTYIFSAVTIANLKRVYNIPAKCACMTLDYGISPYWECVSSAMDYMFLTDDYMIEPFLERGFKREQLYPVGIPIGNQFSTLNDKKATLKKLNLKNIFTVLVMKSGFFPISNASLIKALKKVKSKIQIIIINGTDKKSKKQIDKLLTKHKLQHEVQNLEFVDVIDYYSVADIIVGKGGGLTTTESITAEIPSLIVNKLPQQEIYNKEYLENNGCAIGINKKTLPRVIDDLVQNQDKLLNIKDNCKKIKKTFVLEKFYEVLSKVPKANYLDIQHVTDSKKTVIKKVDKARKLAIKQNKVKK